MAAVSANGQDYREDGEGSNKHCGEAIDSRIVAGTTSHHPSGMEDWECRWALMSAFFPSQGTSVERSV